MSADGVDPARTAGAPSPGRPGPRPTPSVPTAPTPAGGADTPAPAVLGGDLDARLAAIETLPLEDRAAAYTELHDSLRDHLEGGDVPRSKAE